MLFVHKIILFCLLNNLNFYLDVWELNITALNITTQIASVVLMTVSGILSFCIILKNVFGEDIISDASDLCLVWEQ